MYRMQHSTAFLKYLRHCSNPVKLFNAICIFPEVKGAPEKCNHACKPTNLLCTGKSHGPSPCCYKLRLTFMDFSLKMASTGRLLQVSGWLQKSSTELGTLRFAIGTSYLLPQKRNVVCNF